MALLSLPAELRLKIYQNAVTHEPEAINVDDHEKDGDPQGLTTAISIAEVDHRLSGEIVPLFWMSNTFSTNRIGPLNYRSSQRVYKKWLHECVTEFVSKYIRYLRFKEFGRPEQVRQPGHRCVDMIEVDLKDQTVVVYDCKGELCVCSHADNMRDMMQACLPRALGLKFPSIQMLWKLYDHWYRSCAMVKHLRMSDEDVRRARESVDVNVNDANDVDGV